MAHTFSVCSRTPYVQICENVNVSGLSIKGITPSFNVDLGIFRYKLTHGSDIFDLKHQISVCVPPISGIRACVGLDIDNHNLSPFVSIGMSHGSYGYRYKQDLVPIPKCIVERIDHNTIKQTCDDGITNTIQISDVLKQCDDVLNKIQTKVEQTMKDRGITWETIGVSGGDNIGDCGDRELCNPIHRTMGFFDVLDNIKKNIITIPENNVASTGRKWYKTGNIFYPDCCEFGFTCGWYVDYHLAEKIDYCRLCGTPFRLEYFL